MTETATAKTAATRTVAGARARSATLPVLLALYLVATAYNLGKAFHIDDAAHLAIARWIAGHPLHPMAGILNWTGNDVPIWHTNQPHLLFYLYAGWGSLAGFGAVPMHLLQSLFTLAVLLIFHRMSVALGVQRPLLATALLVLNPALIVEQNLMVDVPLLAVWLGVFACLILGRASPRQDLRWAAAGLLCGIALLIKYSSLVLLPVLGLAWIYERQWRRWWALAIPLAPLGAWSAFNYWDYGGVHIAQRQTETRDGVRPAKFAIAWLLAIGALLPLGLPMLLRVDPLWRWRRPVAIAAAAALLALVVAVGSGLLGERAGDIILHGVALLNGLLIMLFVGIAAVAWWRRARRQPAILPADDPAAPLYLAAWLAATTAFYVLLSPFVAPRHVLLILPPLILLAARWRPARASRGLDLFALAATIVLSAGLALADGRFAAFYRDAVPALAARVPAQPGGRRWVRGHWGLQHYAGEAGFREVDTAATRFRPGDVILWSPDVYAEPLLHPIATAPLAVAYDPHPLRSLFCPAEPDRFYHSSNRRLPWILSRRCGQRLILSVVR